MLFPLLEIPEKSYEFSEFVRKLLLFAHAAILHRSPLICEIMEKESR
jgi:hypothetical protein